MLEHGHAADDVVGGHEHDFGDEQGILYWVLGSPHLVYVADYSANILDCSQCYKND